MHWLLYSDSVPSSFLPRKKELVCPKTVTFCQPFDGLAGMEKQTRRFSLWKFTWISHTYLMLRSFLFKRDTCLLLFKATNSGIDNTRSPSLWGQPQCGQRWNLMTYTSTGFRTIYYIDRTIGFPLTNLASSLRHLLSFWGTRKDYCGEIIQWDVYCITTITTKVPFLVRKFDKFR